jgi:pimeloyl-ACP methyl ester carboxylesterase
MGGGVAMQCAIRHPDNVRKVVVISSTFLFAAVPAR